MEKRILSREEWDLLAPDAVELIYRHIYNQHISSDILEKTMLQAVIIARMNQCRIDAQTLSYLIEKISEYEGLPVFDSDENGEDIINRYC